MNKETLPLCPFHQTGCETAIEVRFNRMEYRVIWDCGAAGPLASDRTAAISAAEHLVKRAKDLVDS